MMVNQHCAMSFEEIVYQELIGINVRCVHFPSKGRCNQHPFPLRQIRLYNPSKIGAGLTRFCGNLEWRFIEILL